MGNWGSGVFRYYGKKAMMMITRFNWSQKETLVFLTLPVQVMDLRHRETRSYGKRSNNTKTLRAARMSHCVSSMGELDNGTGELSWDRCCRSRLADESQVYRWVGWRSRKGAPHPDRRTHTTKTDTKCTSNKRHEGKQGKRHFPFLNHTKSWCTLLIKSVWSVPASSVVLPHYKTNK